jgi:hypothetical protein
VSETDLECDPQPTPSELHEEQMDFLAHILDKEIYDHNKTRERLHRYLNLYMKKEREVCSERLRAQYLSSVIDILRAQLKEEQVRRKAVEEEKALLLEESFNNFASVGPKYYCSPCQR